MYLVVVFNDSCPNKTWIAAGDLYHPLKSSFGPMIGVADGELNSFAFRTRESINPQDSNDKFYDLWEREPQPRNLDRVIAEKYKLALYKGSVNKPLKRIV